MRNWSVDVIMKDSINNNNCNNIIVTVVMCTLKELPMVPDVDWNCPL